MQKANNTRPITRFARWVMLWLALAFGVAIASPLVKPQSIELVCSSTGPMKVLLKNAAGEPVNSQHALDCTTCPSICAPPPVVSFVPPVSQPLAYATHPIAHAQRVALTSPPLPARGPPVA